jgi:hypothetical protein
MARPLKQGVEYFPLDVHIDNKLKFIKIKYGLEGYGIIICLLQHIYSLSYWCSVTDDDLLLLSDELKVDFILLNEVIQEAVNRDFFNKELYKKHQILTSKGIQKRYKEIVKRRKDVEIIEEYLVIDNNFGVNEYNNLVNVNMMDTLSKHDVRKSTQSKVKRKESKEKGKDKRFIPTLSEVEDYFLENGYTKQYAKKVFDYYNLSVEDNPGSTYWKDGKGNSIKNWKMKVRIWMKDEGKVQVYNSDQPVSQAKNDGEVFTMRNDVAVQLQAMQQKFKV